jgi:outer membrane receptor for ferrienterochelin and colicins
MRYDVDGDRAHARRGRAQCGTPAASGSGSPRATRTFLVCALAIFLAALGPAVASGQTQEERLEQMVDQLDLQTLLNTPIDVWTPSKAPQKSHEAPSIITTVTREQIRVWGYRSMADLLSHLLGFYVIDDHTSPNLVVRGNSGGLYSESSIIKVLIDGHPVSFSSTGGIGLGPELIPLSAIERVEVIRGPASALYGADAFLGMINIQTRERQDVQGGNAWLTMGQVGSRLATDVDASLGTTRGMVEALVAVRRTQQDLSGLELPASSPSPNIPFYNQGARRASGLDQRSTAAIATVTLRPRASWFVKLFAYYSAMERGAEFGSLLQLANGYNERNAFSENRVSQSQMRGGLQFAQDLSPHLRLSLRGSYFDGGTGADNRLEVGSEYYYVRRRLGFRGGDLDSHLHWSPTPYWSLSSGFGLLLDDEQLPSRIAVAKRPIGAVRNGQIIDQASVYQGRKTFFNAGVYLQGTLRTEGGLLGLTAGLRYDRHNVYGGQLSQRVGLVSSPLPNLHAKLLHGSAFQAPSPFLLHAVPSLSGDVVGNAALLPQYVNTFEFQLEYQPAEPVTLSTDVAYSLLDDKTEFLQQGINKVARNVARTDSLSWENRIDARLHKRVNAHLSFEMQRSTLRSGQAGYVGQLVGTEGSIYPHLMIHSGLAAQLGGWPVRVAVLASYIGSRRASETNILLNRRVYRLPAYLMLDANIASEGFHILRSEQQVSVGLSGHNLLGATGPAPGFNGIDYPLAPRALLAHLNLLL